MSRPTPAADRLRTLLAELDEELPSPFAGMPTAELEAGRVCGVPFGTLRRALETMGYTLHRGPCKPAPLVPVSPGARLDDATTSHVAAARALPRARSVAFAMLRAFYDVGERGRDATVEYASLNADEAGALAERFKPGAARGSWRRMSELARFGLIEPAVDGDGKPLERDGLSGSPQRLYRITAKGRRYLADVASTTPEATP